MLNYARKCFKVRKVFHTLILETKSVTPRFCISDTSNSFFDYIKISKESADCKMFVCTFLIVHGVN